MCSIQALFHHAMITMRLNFSTHMAISLAILPLRPFQVCSKAQYQFRNVVHANANHPIRLLLRQLVKILCFLRPHYAAPCSPKHHSPHLHLKRIPFLRVVPMLSKLGGGYQKRTRFLRKCQAWTRIRLPPLCRIKSRTKLPPRLRAKLSHRLPRLLKLPARHMH